MYLVQYSDLWISKEGMGFRKYDIPEYNSETGKVPDIPTSAFHGPHFAAIRLRTIRTNVIDSDDFNDLNNNVIAVISSPNGQLVASLCI